MFEFDCQRDVALARRVPSEQSCFPDCFVLWSVGGGSAGGYALLATHFGTVQICPWRRFSLAAHCCGQLRASASPLTCSIIVFCVKAGKLRRWTLATTDLADRRMALFFACGFPAWSELNDSLAGAGKPRRSSSSPGAPFDSICRGRFVDGDPRLRFFSSPSQGCQRELKCQSLAAVLKS